MIIELILRRSIFKVFKQKYYTFFAKIKCNTYGRDIKANGRTWLTKNTILGNNVNFNGFEVNGGGRVFIGSNFHSGSGCKVITDIHNYNSGEAIPYDSTYIRKDVVIEDNVWLGDDVTVLAGVKIGEGAVIQAGSVITKSIENYAIAGGHPCKPFKKRNIEHYMTLKNNKKFH